MTGQMGEIYKAATLVVALETISGNLSDSKATLRIADVIESSVLGTAYAEESILLLSKSL